MKRLERELIETVREPVPSWTDFAACLDALGKYTTEQFVLRLSPTIHAQLDRTASGVYSLSELDDETVQAFSTYLHETVHWWQHIGSFAGFVLSLTYPAQAHQNFERLEHVLRTVGPKKSIKSWSEQAAVAGVDAHADSALAAANVAVNNAIDAEFYKIIVLHLGRDSVEAAMNHRYFENVGHCYWMAYGHAIAVLGATVDRDGRHLPNGEGWEAGFRRVRSAGVEGWVHGEPTRRPPFGLYALFEGQARILQLQYVTSGRGNTVTCAELERMGYFAGVYGEAFKFFLKSVQMSMPTHIDDPLVGLFLLVVDLSINPTAGFPLEIQSFENFILDVDPGVRFLRFCQEIILNPDLLSAVKEYSKEEYLRISQILCSACGYDSPERGLQKIVDWATKSEGIAALLKEQETFQYEPDNLVLRVLFSHFIRFSKDKLQHPEFFCWAGIWMTGEHASDHTMNLWMRHLSLFTDRADDDGIFPRKIPGCAEESLIRTLSIFYGNIVQYDLVRQWILQDEPFQYRYGWLSQQHTTDEMKAWAKSVFERTFRVHPDKLDSAGFAYSSKHND